MIAGTSPALADPLAAARSAKARVDYERALVEVVRALDRGGLPLAATREALLLRGEFLAVLGRSDEAVAAFVEVLALEPAIRIDPGLAPRVQQAFDQAAGQRPAAASVSCTIDPGGTLRVGLEPGASARARFVRVERAAGAGSPPKRDQVTPPSRLVIGAATRIACFAVDDRGNSLAAGPGWDRALAWSPAEAGGEPPASAVGATATAPRPLWRNPWLWGGAALAAGAGGATFAWLARRDQDRLDRLIANDEENEFADAEAVYRRGRSRVRWSRGLFVAAGLLAGGAVTFALLPRRSAPAGRARAAIVVEPQALWLSGEF